MGSDAEGPPGAGEEGAIAGAVGEAPQGPQAALEGKLIANRYIISHRIGEGPLWYVYLAQDIKSGEAVSVKVMREDVAAEPEATPRFLKQAEDVFKLAHPNIVRTIGTGTEDGRHFLITQYVYGRNIRQWFVEEGRSFSDLRDKLKVICEALSYAHSTGIFHRSIKPENIFIDPDGIVRITDFGFARRLESCTRPSSAGTSAVAYITPEQAKGQRGDARSDLYSLGVVLYELATGKLPFWAPDPVRIVFKHINDTPVRPRQVNPRVPSWVEHVVLKLLEKDPNQRFQSTREVFEELARLERQGEGQFIEMPLGETAGSRPGIAPLVGRDEVEQHLREHLREAAAGKGRTVIVSGPSGIGKTRLLGELSSYGRVQGMTALRGAASRPERAIFAPLLQMVSEYLRKGDMRVRDVLAEGGSLEAYLEGRSDEFLSSDASAFVSRYQELFVQFFEAVEAASGPTMLVVEDAGNLDELSINVLRELGKRAPGKRLLLAISHVTAPAAHSAAAELIKDLLAQPNSEHFALDPLNEAHVRELVGDLSGAERMSSDLVGAIEKASAGVPLHIEELVALLLREKVLEVTEKGDLRATNLDQVVSHHGLARLFEKRMATLPQKVGMVLTVAAAIGPAFDFDVLLKVSGRNHDEVISILQWAERHRLIEGDWAPGRDRFRFRYDVIAEVLYGGLDARSRKRLHLLIGGSMEEYFASRLREVYEALAYHYRESDQWEKSIEYSTLAAERFYALKAFEAAYTCYLNALDTSDMVDPQAPRRLHWLKRLAQVARALGDETTARKWAQQGITVARDRGDEAEIKELEELLA